MNTEIEFEVNKKEYIATVNINHLLDKLSYDIISLYEKDAQGELQMIMFPEDYLEADGIDVLEGRVVSVYAKTRSQNIMKKILESKYNCLHRSAPPKDLFVLYLDIDSYNFLLKQDKDVVARDFHKVFSIYSDKEHINVSTLNWWWLYVRNSI